MPREFEAGPEAPLDEDDAAALGDVREVAVALQRPGAIDEARQPGPGGEGVDAVRVHHVQHTKGVAVTGINLRDLRKLPIPYAPLAEQRRVADILDKADAIRRKRKDAIALTEELLRSAFLEMFGDPVTNPKGWPVKPLGELLEFLTSGSRGWAQYYADSGDTFLRIQNVRRDQLDLSDVAYVQAPDSAEARRTGTRPGDVLLSITADLGRTAVVPTSLERAFINQHLAILRPNKHIAPEYLSAFLASEAGQRQINKRNKGGVKAGLNFDDIRSIEVPIPAPKLQSSFAATKIGTQGIEVGLSRALEYSPLRNLGTSVPINST